MKLFKVKTSEGIVYCVEDDEPSARDAVRGHNQSRHFATSVVIESVEELADESNRGFTPKLIIS